MKKISLLLFACGLITFSSKAQVANYLFSQATSTYTEITGGAVIGNTSTNDQRFLDPSVPLGSTTLTTGPGLPIGFNFVYNGNTFDVIGIHANGWISLGQSSLSPDHVNMATSSYTNAISATSTAPSILQNRIAGLSRDLQAQAGAELRYETIGAAPNRTLVIQWKNYRRMGLSGESYNFQVRLYETTNVIEFAYGAFTVNYTNNTHPQVGLRGTAASGVAPTDFNNRTSTTNWLSSNAGISNASTITLSTTVFPISGLTYIFTPLANDAGISAINSPVSTVHTGLSNVTATIKNFGTDTLKNASIAWSVNGVLQTPHIWTGNLAMNAVDGPVIIGSYNFTGGTFDTIKVWTENPNGSTDLNHVNDTSVNNVYVQNYAPLPFIENFDNTWVNKFNTRDVPGLFWINTPATGNPSWRRFDDGTSASWTSTNGAYTDAGASGTSFSARFHSYETPAASTGTMDAFLNFSTTGDKTLEFWYINPSGTDSLSVYMSTDEGSSYTFVQKITTTTSVWTKYSISLGSSTASNVILRFKATSDYGDDDIGIDQVNVFILQPNDMAAVEWLSPLSGCGHTASDSVTIKITNIGTQAQSNIPVFYTIDGGQTIVGTEIITGTVNPGDTLTYTFTQHADFSTAGNYSCIAGVGLLTDQNNNNDTVFASINSLGTINSFPFTENFNNPNGTLYFSLTSAANADAYLVDTSGVSNTGCAFFTGFSSSTGWTGTGTIPAAEAYGYASHLSTLAPCNVDATGLTDLRMKFDLKQTYYTQKTYTWLVLVANGTDTLTDIDGIKYYNPVTTSSDPFKTKTFDLSAYAGTAFTLEFKSACKYNAAAGTPGNNNYIDNIKLYVPPADDAGVSALLSPASTFCGNSNDSVVVVVNNYGTASQTNIPVEANIITPTGIVTLSGSLAGPLAPGSSDTIKLGNINTTTHGNYIFNVYTNLANDTIFENDTIHSIILTDTAFTIPHLENFESSTSLLSWNTDFLRSNGHGNTSYVLYKNLRNTATTGNAKMNKKIGVITNNSYLTFDYRIVNLTSGTATTLTKDSVRILVSSDCGSNYNTIYIIDTLTHITSTSMAHKVLPLADYAGSDVLLGINAKWAAGNYYLDFDNIAVSKKATVDIGQNTYICPGSDITFDAGIAPAGYTYSYNWSTLNHPGTIATTRTITVDSAATYFVSVNNGFGVYTYDTITITMAAAPTVSLGNNTKRCVSYIIDAGAGYASYLWSTDETSNSITVTSTGNYSVTVTNDLGCSAADNINVVIIPLPTVYAGTNQSLCYLDTLQLTEATSVNYDSLLWTTSGDGHFNDSTLLNPYYIAGTADSTNGTANITLTAYAYCDTINSHIVFNITSSAVAVAGSDETICLGESVQLSATGGNTYLWSPSTGLSDSTISNPIAHPAITTTYTVTVTGSCGNATDDVTVTVDHIITPNLGADTIMCANNSITLNAGPGYDSYNWSTGSTLQTINVDTAGIGTGTFPYWVQVTNGVCSAADTVNITFAVCTGNTELSQDAAINIFPNPTDGIINILLNGFNSKADLAVYSLQGQLVFADKISNNSAAKFNLSFLPKGVYFIRIYNARISVLSKIILQ